jgi:hypothetical protein
MSEKNWLESALGRELEKVAAPAELWQRVQRPAARRRAVVGRLAWAFVLGLAVVAAAGLGLRTHASHTAGVAELRSDDPVQIRGWVRGSTGLDVALPGVLAPAVRLTGARIVNAGVPSVEVAYRVGDREATLLVTRAAGSGDVRHADLRAVSEDGKITWAMHGQVYTLSTGGLEEARTACLLCHVS